ncbi:MAG: hypothetical protein LBJ15_18275 [Comamonas sp.]|uniref:hypothetical protein n=1 Tax=Comamonas sp. TaxID=34028 RepID=UPI002834F6DD|nr:hypothetical protein [Comamonas sp.]MDR0215924.1 hypothetical protein [Comamonas sp.]
MKTVEKQPTEKKMDKLDWSMWRWQAVVIALGILLLLAYAFAFKSSANLLGDHGQEKWGQFGDFIGGIMNPLVAFAAFYWLTQSVKLQKQELAETRKALEESAKAQTAQVTNGKASVRLAALSALANSLQSDISSELTTINSFTIGAPEEHGRRHYYMLDKKETIEACEARIKVKQEERDLILREMREILSRYAVEGAFSTPVAPE